MLTAIKATFAADVIKNKTSLATFDEKGIRKVLSRTATDVGKRMVYFLATGNLPSMSGMDLQQVRA